jgi:hypothetical protein
MTTNLKPHSCRCGKAFATGSELVSHESECPTPEPATDRKLTDEREAFETLGHHCVERMIAILYERGLRLDNKLWDAIGLAIAATAMRGNWLRATPASENERLKAENATGERLACLTEDNPPGWYECRFLRNEVDYRVTRWWDGKTLWFTSRAADVVDKREYGEFSGPLVSWFELTDLRAKLAAANDYAVNLLKHMDKTPETVCDNLLGVLTQIDHLYASKRDEAAAVERERDEAIKWGEGRNQVADAMTNYVPDGAREERLRHERTGLARGIGEAAKAFGIIDGTQPLTGPQLLCLCDDLANIAIGYETFKADAAREKQARETAERQRDEAKDTADATFRAARAWTALMNSLEAMKGLDLADNEKMDDKLNAYIASWSAMKERAETAEQKNVKLLELSMDAWGLIANAYGGNWQNAPREWQVAAARWREGFHGMLNTANAGEAGE